MVSTSTSPGCAAAITAWTIRLSSWPQSTVRAGPATREPGIDLDQVEVDHARAGPRLVDRRGAEPRQLVVAARSQLATTCGITRWKASAKRTPGRRDSAARGCRAARRAGRSRSAGTSAPSSPPSPRACARSPAVMSTNVVGVKLHSSGWWGSKRNSAGGLIVLKALLHAGAGGERAARSVDGEGDRVVGVERVAVGVGDDHVGGELADRVDEPVERLAVDLERVVAEVEAAEARAERGRRRLGLGVADAASRSRPSGPPPSTARRTRRARRRTARSRCAVPPFCGGHGERAAGAPDEVGRVGADREQPCGSCVAPATPPRVRHRHRAHLLLVEAGLRGAGRPSAAARPRPAG